MQILSSGERESYEAVLIQTEPSVVPSLRSLCIAVARRNADVVLWRSRVVWLDSSCRWQRIRSQTCSGFERVPLVYLWSVDSSQWPDLPAAIPKLWHRSTPSRENQAGFIGGLMDDFGRLAPECVGKFVLGAWAVLDDVKLLQEKCPSEKFRLSNLESMEPRECFWIGPYREEFSLQEWPIVFHSRNCVKHSCLLTW